MIISTLVPLCVPFKLTAAFPSTAVTQTNRVIHFDTWTQTGRETPFVKAQVRINISKFAVSTGLNDNVL